jgi:acetyl-CoA C-acetyltransferase
VYPRGWCYATDPVYVAEHPDLGRSPAMTAVFGEVLDLAGTDADGVAHFDLYSCFGSSLNFARDALGLALGDPRSLTVTGGLPYHGGPASNYMSHSIATMVEVLRADPGSLGIVSGVGMHMTKHVAGAYSTAPGPLRLPDPGRVQARLDARPPMTVIATHAGDATVATYSVIHGRDGAPVTAVLVCDVGEGARTYAVARDPDFLREAEETELVGRRVRLRPEPVPSHSGGEGVRNVAT